MGKFKAIVSDMEDTIRNTFVEMAHSLSGSEGSEVNIAKLRDVEMVFQLEGDVEITQKSGNA